MDLLTLAGDGICPKCKKKTLHHGPEGKEWITLCVNCGFKIKGYYKKNKP